ncbi:MAG: flavodoxin family protein [bacterium]
MNVLGVSGSARVWGNCESVVRTVLLSSVEKGANCKFIRLTDLRIDLCKGCFRCIREGICGIDDDLRFLLGLISECDAMVIAAPVYFMVPSSQLIRLLDRLLIMGSSNVPLRPAITITLMGNSKWRGVAEPIVNMATSLLGFEVIASVGQVAEGPGEALLDKEAIERLGHLGRFLVERNREVSRKLMDYEQNRSAALRSEIILESRRGVCNFCRSDFFRIDGKAVVCPICGNVGDLSQLVESGDFRQIGYDQRWGLRWLRTHIDSWVKPSVDRYKRTSRRALSAVADLRRRSEKVIEDVRVGKRTG